MPDIPGLPRGSAYRKHEEPLVSHLDELQGKVDALKCMQSDTATELDALMPSILDKAFRGEF
jgi:hypothetical protein